MTTALHVNKRPVRGVFDLSPAITATPAEMKPALSQEPPAGTLLASEWNAFCCDVLGRLMLMSDTPVSIGSVQDLCESSVCTLSSAATWNWGVRLSSVVSVAASLGAVYVRCGRPLLPTR